MDRSWPWNLPGHYGAASNSLVTNVSLPAIETRNHFWMSNGDSKNFIKLLKDDAMQSTIPHLIYC